MEAGGVMEHVVTLEKLTAALRPIRGMAFSIQGLLDAAGAVLGGAVSVDSVRQKALLMMYPVGSIYLSALDTSPASFLGGTWEQIKDVFLESAAVADAGTAEPKGEASHVLTVDEMPAHHHRRHYRAAAHIAQITKTRAAAGDDKTIYTYSGSGNDPAVVITSSTGGDQAHNNLPPYLVVCMWKRVA